MRPREAARSLGSAGCPITGSAYFDGLILAPANGHDLARYFNRTPGLEPMNIARYAV